MAKKIILSRKSKQKSTPWFETKKGFRVKLTNRVTETITCDVSSINCLRCNAPAFVKLDKSEWRNPKYPIYECQSCSYFEERFE